MTEENSSLDDCVANFVLDAPVCEGDSAVAATAHDSALWANMFEQWKGKN